MKSWKELKKELLADKEVAKEYERLGPYYELISEIIKKRRQKGLTQNQLAKKVGTKQSAIARLESGSTNPSLEFIEKIAQAMDSKLRIVFE